MNEQKKDDCCGGSSNSGCGCCGGVKKLIVVGILALVIFTCGYIFGKGHCPFTGSCKICPMTQH